MFCDPQVKIIPVIGGVSPKIRLCRNSGVVHYAAETAQFDFTVLNRCSNGADTRNEPVPVP